MFSAREHLKKYCSHSAASGGRPRGLAALTQSVFVSLHQAMSGYISLSQPILTPLFFSAGGDHDAVIKPFQGVSRYFQPFSEKKDCLFLCATSINVIGPACRPGQSFCPSCQKIPSMGGHISSAGSHQKSGGSGRFPAAADRKFFN